MVTHTCNASSSKEDHRLATKPHLVASESGKYTVVIEFYCILLMLY